MKLLGFEIKRIHRISKAQAAMNLSQQAHSRITALEAQQDELIEQQKNIVKMLEKLNGN